MKRGKGDLLTLFALAAAVVTVEAVQVPGVCNLAWWKSQTGTGKCVKYLGPVCQCSQLFLCSRSGVKTKLLNPTFL